MGTQVYRMERDRARFREIVRGRLREDLRKYLSTSELLGRQGKHAISIPVPQIELPRVAPIQSSLEASILRRPGAEVGDLPATTVDQDHAGLD